jgi:predicted nucleic acid-binding protein
MPDEAVVADSGPLIALALGQCLHLLRDLYGIVLVPDAVWREVTEAGQGRAGAAEIAAASWLSRTTLGRRSDPLLRAELGPI